MEKADKLAFVYHTLNKYYFVQCTALRPLYGGGGSRLTKYPRELYFLWEVLPQGSQGLGVPVVKARNILGSEAQIKKKQKNPKKPCFFDLIKIKKMI